MLVHAGFEWMNEPSRMSRAYELLKDDSRAALRIVFSPTWPLATVAAFRSCTRLIQKTSDLRRGPGPDWGTLTRDLPLVIP